MAIFVSKRNIKNEKEKLGFIKHLPKSIKKYFSKKDETVSMQFGPFDGVSRVPFGGDVFGEYSINPSAEKFEAFLSEELFLLLSESTDCVDGQNGNVFDNIIDRWLEIAIQNIEEQKNMRSIALKAIIDSRQANLVQAQEYIQYEKDELDRINNHISEIQQKIKNR